MPQPLKTSEVTLFEKKSHRTKKEIEAKQSAENALVTGKPLKERTETKANKIAHAEFLRMNALLKIIGKNDAIIEAIVNRYCILQAECFDFETKKNEISYWIKTMQEDEEVNSQEKYLLVLKMQNNIISLDKQLQTKRRMLFDIERENGMTISAASRTIPPKVSTVENPLLRLLDDG